MALQRFARLARSLPLLLLMPLRPLAAPPLIDLTITVESPQAFTTLTTDPATVLGWAIDPSTPEGTGVDQVLIALDGQADAATYGLPRPDLAAQLGDRFATAGFTYPLPDACTLGTGKHTLTVYAHSTAGRWADTIVPFAVIAACAGEPPQAAPSPSAAPPPPTGPAAPGVVPPQAALTAIDQVVTLHAPAPNARVGLGGGNALPPPNPNLPATCAEPAPVTAVLAATPPPPGVQWAGATVRPNDRQALWTDRVELAITEPTAVTAWLALPPTQQETFLDQFVANERQVCAGSEHAVLWVTIWLELTVPQHTAVPVFVGDEYVQPLPDGRVHARWPDVVVHYDAAWQRLTFQSIRMSTEAAHLTA